MIIPIKCFTCGKPLADKYQFYLEQVRYLKSKDPKYANMDRNAVEYFTHENSNKSYEGEVMDLIGLKKMCCRRHMLSHVDIE